MQRILDRNEEQFVRESDKGVNEKWKWSLLTPSLRRPYIHAFFFPTACRTACKHAFRFLRVLPEAVSTRHCTRGCDKRWMTCIHAGVSRSPREHTSVPPTCSVEVPGTNL